MRNFCPTPLLDENQNSLTQNSVIPYPEYGSMQTNYGAKVYINALRR